MTNYDYTTAINWRAFGNGSYCYEVTLRFSDASELDKFVNGKTVAITPSSETDIEAESETEAFTCRSCDDSETTDYRPVSGSSRSKDAPSELPPIFTPAYTDVPSGEYNPVRVQRVIRD